MKKIKQILILSSLLILFSFSHPIKLTSSIFKYDKETKGLSMECKVFVDDFAPAIDQALEHRINNKTLTKDDLSRIEDYFTQLRLKYVAYSRGKFDCWTISSQRAYTLGVR